MTSLERTVEPADCPVCGTPIEGWDWSQELRPQVNLLPLWDGGPLVEVPGIMTKHEPVPGSQRFTLMPCAHLYYGTLTVHERTVSP